MTNPDFIDILAQAQEQLADIARIQKEQAALIATATTANGLVTVSVNAQGVVIETKIDGDYLDDHTLTDLGKHITQAAQAAARDVQSQVAALLVPISERRKAFPSLGDLVEGAPDLRDLTVDIPKPSLAPPNSPERISLDGDPAEHRSPDDDGEDPWYGTGGVRA